MVLALAMILSLSVNVFAAAPVIEDVEYEGRGLVEVEFKKDVRYKNVKVIDGFRLVPHLPEYFRDNLHPNELGAEVYGRNLAGEIRRIGF